MSSQLMSFESRLQAIGWLLDQHPGAVKEICILQAGDGFVINMLAADDGSAGPTYIPVTRVVEESEFQAALKEVHERRGKWWRR